MQYWVLDHESQEEVKEDWITKMFKLSEGPSPPSPGSSGGTPVKKAGKKASKTGAKKANPKAKSKAGAKSKSKASTSSLIPASMLSSFCHAGSEWRCLG